MKVSQFCQRYDEATDSMRPEDPADIDVWVLLDRLADEADYQITCFDSIGEPELAPNIQYWANVLDRTRALMACLAKDPV